MASPNTLLLVPANKYFSQNVSVYFNSPNSGIVATQVLESGSVICSTTCEVTQLIADSTGYYNYAHLINWQNELSYFIKSEEKYTYTPYNLSSRSYKENGKLYLKIDVTFTEQPTHIKYPHEQEFREISKLGIPFSGTLFVNYRA